MELTSPFFGLFKGVRTAFSDDLIDRLHCPYSPLLFLVLSVVVISKQYVGEPIVCRCPAQFSENWEEYTNKFCWISNTYRVPISEKNIPEDDNAKDRINYYQWVPLMMLLQAFLFIPPHIVWQFLSERSNLDLVNVIRAANVLHHGAYYKDSQIHRQYIVSRFRQYFSRMRKSSKLSKWQRVRRTAGRLTILYGKRSGSYVATCYMFTKILKLINVIGQLFLLMRFLEIGPKDPWMLLRSTLYGGDWNPDGPRAFPRITMCDVKVRTLNNIQQYTVQCVLTVNVFQEKIYILVWFWMSLLCVLTFVNIFTWLIRLIIPYSANQYVRDNLLSYELTDCSVLQLNEDDLRSFLTDDRVTNFRQRKAFKSESVRMVLDLLQTDGVLLLRFIGININKIVVSDILRDIHTFAFFLAHCKDELPETVIVGNGFPNGRQDNNTNLFPARTTDGSSEDI